jgi:hypothetical protein
VLDRAACNGNLGDGSSLIVRKPRNIQKDVSGGSGSIVCGHIALEIAAGNVEIPDIPIFDDDSPSTIVADVRVTYIYLMKINIV